MEGVLYLPHVVFNDKDVFDYGDKQIRTIKNDLTFKTSFNVNDYDNIKGVGNGFEDYYFKLKHNTNEYMYDGNLEKRTMEENIVFYPCIINFMDSDYNQLTIDDLLYYHKTGEPIPSIIEFDLENMSPEAEIESKVWINNCMSIHEAIKNNYNNTRLVSKLVDSLPRRTFKLIVPNNYNKESKCILEECKIMGKIAENKFYVLIDALYFFS